MSPWLRPFDVYYIRYKWLQLNVSKLGIYLFLILAIMALQSETNEVEKRSPLKDQNNVCECVQKYKWT